MYFFWAHSFNLAETDNITHVSIEKRMLKKKRLYFVSMGASGYSL